jgi:rubrerythrin
VVNPVPSCCKQVKDFVHFGKELHAEVRKLFEAINDHAELERVRMLLDYLSRHEHHMEESLARFEKSSHSGILEAWLEYSPSLDVEAVMNRYVLPEKPSSDEIVNAAMAFDDTLVVLYREVAAKVNDQKVKALFNNLLALEEKERIQVARAVMDLADM